MFEINDVDFDLRKIADSGQVFRITEENGIWTVLSADKICRAIIEGNCCTIRCSTEDDSYWKHYFDIENDYKAYRDSVDENDGFLKAAVEHGKGIRILNQDPWEMLISFIISQRKNIPAIRSCIEKICRRWGRELEPGIYAFPTPEELTAATLDELCECSLGYRAEYVYLASKAVAEGTLDLSSLVLLDDDELLGKLLSLKGVGIKVANCVLLFGFHRIGAFPVDVWIDRVQKEYYGGHFPTEKYEGYAGVMQQYIFYYARTL